MWLLQHKHFQKWLKQDESGPLLITADPGCGKSVLAKYLIDHGLPESAASSSICYFFFKDQDQNTSRQALCALLHQLFSQKPALIAKHAIPQYNKNGKDLIKATNVLWDILQSGIRDPEAGCSILVLDALDECDELELASLIKNLESLFHSRQLSKPKVLLTCRPYQQIISKLHGLFRNFPNIHIPGEEESEVISQEVDSVIQHRINQLSLSPKIKNCLEEKLREIPHRTYLWVHLIFDHIQRGDFKQTLKGAELLIQKLPRNINDAYERILNRSKEEQEPIVRKALGIILAACRPLTLSEMNVAMSIDDALADDTAEIAHSLDLEDESDFKSRLRSWCGLFISIHQGRVYFLHQTAREFLLADPASATLIERQWHHSITIRQAHRLLAKLFILYINLVFSDVPFHRKGHEIDLEFYGCMEPPFFLGYASEYWAAHFREAHIIDGDSMIPATLRICNPILGHYTIYHTHDDLSEHHNSPDCYQEPTNLMIASYFGLYSIVKFLVDHAANVEAKDKTDRTPLFWAAVGGHEEVVKLLIENGADIEAKDNLRGYNPLSKAAREGHEAVVKLLIDEGANISAKSKDGQTPLLLAASQGNEAIIQLLVKKGANVQAKDNFGQTPLLMAAHMGNKAISKLLVEKGADIEARDFINQTPLNIAAKQGHEAIVKLLVEKGAEIEAKDTRNQTPLAGAAYGGYNAVVRLLIEKGADIEAKNSSGETPLAMAVGQGHEATTGLLIAKGADLKAKNRDGETLLIIAIRKEREAMVRLLMKQGADIEARNNWGQTPLFVAVLYNAEAIVKLLVENGADIRAKDNDGRTPLSIGKGKGYKLKTIGRIGKKVKSTGR